MSDSVVHILAHIIQCLDVESNPRSTKDIYAQTLLSNWITYDNAQADYAASVTDLPWSQSGC